MKTVAKWDLFELEYKGKTEGNPYTDYKIMGTFTGPGEKKTVEGFYDGDGIYRIRYMPSFEGEYSYQIQGDFSDETYNGAFHVTAPAQNNHGPMRVFGYHFAHEDGTVYYQVGTTCYAWVHQSDEMFDKTIETLSKGYFNKIRFCVFPKHMPFNYHEPQTYPYLGTACTPADADFEMIPMGIPPAQGNDWDFTRFNPEHFKRLDKAIAMLGQMGIEADIILMHAYDRWGFSTMNQEQDDLYMNYVVARFSAYRNVWWSLANEWDLLWEKKISDWERYASIIVKKDPYNHLRSIHNCRVMYDHSIPWITHCSIQKTNPYVCAELVDEYRARYKKPIVLDEISYEGNIEYSWGNIEGTELVRRFWEASVRGGYAGHGETYYAPDGMLWWSHGGVLHGESQDRIKFLHEIMCQTPGHGLRLSAMPIEYPAGQAEAPDKEYYLVYLGRNRPAQIRIPLSDEHKYHINKIDTWNMTISDEGIHTGTTVIQLPGSEYMALQIRRVE